MSTNQQFTILVESDQLLMFIQGDIFKHLKELQLARKDSSTEVYQPFLLINTLNAELYFSSPPLLGALWIPQRKLIDIDEFGICIKQCNPKYGFLLSCYHVRKPGHYVQSTQLSVLFVIKAEDPRLPAATYGSLSWPQRLIK
eukprot:8943772-Ditylum_brightwellii.AAC.1